MKIVINNCHGGFHLSEAAVRRMLELGYETDVNHETLIQYGNYNCDRTDPILLKVVEELGKAADGDCAELKIIEIPDDVDYEIMDYDGIEMVVDRNRCWE